MNGLFSLGIIGGADGPTAIFLSPAGDPVRLLLLALLFAAALFLLVRLVFKKRKK